MSTIILCVPTSLSHLADLVSVSHVSNDGSLIMVFDIFIVSRGTRTRLAIQTIRPTDNGLDVEGLVVRAVYLRST